MVQHFDKNLSMEKIDEDRYECEGVFELSRSGGRILGDQVKVETKCEDTIFGINCGFIGMQILEAEKVTTEQMNEQFQRVTPRQKRFSFKEIFKKRPLVGGRLNVEASFDEIHEHASPFKEKVDADESEI